MGWTEGTNQGALGPGVVMEYGTALLSGGTIEVPTRMTEISAALYTFAEDPSADTRMFCDLVITEGAVTFADGAVSAKTFNYILFGH